MLTCGLSEKIVDSKTGALKAVLQLNRPIKTSEGRKIVVDLHTKVWRESIKHYTANKYGVAMTAFFRFDRNDSSKILGDFFLNTAFLEHQKELLNGSSNLSAQQQKEVENGVKEYQKVFCDVFDDILQDFIDHINWFDDESYFRRRIKDLQTEKTPS